MNEIEELQAQLIAAAADLAAAYGGLVGNLNLNSQIDTSAEANYWRGVGDTYQPSTEKTAYMTAANALCNHFAGGD